MNWNVRFLLFKITYENSIINLFIRYKGKWFLLSTSQLVPSNLSYFAIRNDDHTLVITGQYVHNLVLISVYITISKQIK